MKTNFLPGRSFHDDQDLAEQCQAWLVQVNASRLSDATGELPTSRLVEEQRAFTALPASASDYGFFDCVVVNRESLVMIESNQYSVPTHLVGRALTARIHRTHLDLVVNGLKSLGKVPRRMEVEPEGWKLRVAPLGNPPGIWYTCSEELCIRMFW